MMGRLVRTFGRFVGLIFAILGFWILVLNLVEHSYEGWTLVWIVASGLAGAAGGVAYLLSFDGPSRFRRRRVRVAGWVGMLFLAVLPTSLIFILFALVLLTIPTLFLREPGAGETAATTA